jgi:hypothetical protein
VAGLVGGVGEVDGADGKRLRSKRSTSLCISSGADTFYNLSNVSVNQGERFQNVHKHSTLRANFIKTLTGLITLTAGDNVHVNHEIKSYERKYY